MHENCKKKNSGGYEDTNYSSKATAQFPADVMIKNSKFDHKTFLKLVEAKLKP